MKTLLELSSRTVRKILARMNLGCSVCGWNEAIGDLHRILPSAKGGSDEHFNLTYLCPNHHRLAHSGKLLNFVNLESQIGDKWKEFYYPRVASSISIETVKRNLEKARAKHSQLATENAVVRLANFHAANIDTSKRGWRGKAAKVLGLTPQRVSWWLEKYGDTGKLESLGGLMQVHDS